MKGRDREGRRRDEVEERRTEVEERGGQERRVGEERGERNGDGGRGKEGKDCRT